jgi:hypothetical protein
LVEALGGDVIEVPLAAVLRSKLDAVGPDQDARKALRASFVEPPLGWSLSRQVRYGMDETLEHERGGLREQFRHLAVALGLEQGVVPPCVSAAD